VAGLIVSLAIVIVPHATRAPWWISAAALVLYAWRARLAIARAPLPSFWLLITLAVLALACLWLEYRMIFARSPGIMMLVLFSGLKLLESRNHRDATILMFLCYFLIITNFLYTQTIPMALLMVAALLAVTATLVGFNAPHRTFQSNLRTAGTLLAHAAPAALVLFVLFPRVEGPFWRLPQDAHAGVTGLSDSMAPGGMTQLALSDAIAFRAEFDGKPPPQRQRYWRGPVLWDFDGRTWRAGATVITRFVPSPRAGTTYRYSVVLEPHDRDWMFALEQASRLPQRAAYTTDGRLISRAPVRTRLRYELESVVEPGPMPEGIQPREFVRALRIPADFNPRAREIAARWRAQAASPQEILMRGIEFLRAGRLTYTLEPPPLGRDSVDDFLFETKAGFCEHFSSAFAFLMRAAGVPARIVTGYQGGETNPVDRIVTVRQSDAHAWVEVFLPGQGWVRVDPTGASVPERVESGLARSVRGVELLPLMSRERIEWLQALRYNWEALAHKWNMWVLGYNPERQRELVSLFGMRDADWRSLTTALVTLLGSFTALLVLWSLRRLAPPDPVQSAWLRFCRKLAAGGIARSSYEGPQDYADRAARGLPQAEASIRRIAQLYIALRYGRSPSAGEISELKRLVRRFRAA
jgi:transglutaminase-like putative cysteine protease